MTPQKTEVFSFHDTKKREVCMVSQTSFFRQEGWLLKVLTVDGLSCSTPTGDANFMDGCPKSFPKFPQEGHSFVTDMHHFCVCLHRMIYYTNNVKIYPYIKP